jgi:hypothetical protein
MLLCVTDGSALLGKAFWPRLKSGNEQQDQAFAEDTPKCALKGEL